MTTAITPEVISEDIQILEESPMTDAEQKELIIVKTAIQSAYADKLERDLAIGAGLLKIFRRKLYRSKEGGRSWKQWLEDESAELTAGRGSIGEDTSQRLRGFYQFRCEVLQAPALGRTGVALPTSPRQVRPLLGQLDTHPEAALEMWKAACAEAGVNKVPTFDQVNRAALAYKANEANEARRFSPAQQVAHRKAVAASIAVNTASNSKPQDQPSSRDYSPQTPTSFSSVGAWEIEKDDSSIDAGAECRKVTLAINEAHKAVGLLRGMLYSQINKYGRDYLGFLRQVDAGIYSLHNIDEQVAQLGEDIDFIAELLIADIGEGELAASTVNVVAMPTRA